MIDPDTGNGRRPTGAAFTIAAFLAGLGALLIWQGRDIPDKGGYSGVSSGDMPVFVGICLIVLAVAHILTGLRYGDKAVPRQQPLPVLLIVAGLALQLLLLQVVGFAIASGLLFACTAAAFGKRNFAISLPVGIAFALIIYGVFDRLLKLNLPGRFLENLIFGG